MGSKLHGVGTLWRLGGRGIQDATQSPPPPYFPATYANAVSFCLYKLCCFLFTYHVTLPGELESAQRLKSCQGKASNFRVKIGYFEAYPNGATLNVDCLFSTVLMRILNWAKAKWHRCPKHLNRWPQLDKSPPRHLSHSTTNHSFTPTVIRLWLEFSN